MFDLVRGVTSVSAFVDGCSRLDIKRSHRTENPPSISAHCLTQLELCAVDYVGVVFL